MTIHALRILREMFGPKKTWWDIPSKAVIHAMIIAKARQQERRNGNA